MRNSYGPHKSVIDSAEETWLHRTERKIGVCGYINELSREELRTAIHDYREICMGYDRNGKGIQPLCVDVGLEDPSEVSKQATPTVAA